MNKPVQEARRERLVIKYSAAEVAHIITGHLIATGQLSPGARWDLNISLDSNGADIVVAFPEHAHKYITDEDGCVLDCACGARWKPAEKAKAKR